MKMNSKGFGTIVLIVCLYALTFVWFSKKIHFSHHNARKVIISDDMLSDEIIVNHISAMHGLTRVEKYMQEMLSRANETTQIDLDTYTGPTILEPKCSGKPYLLVQVHSAPNHLRQRYAIRYSWGGMLEKAEKQWHRVIFVLGRSHSSLVNKQILHEAKTFNDILFMNMMDGYRNLSHKTIAAVRWSSKSCVAEYMLKTDDDCFVNVNNLVNVLQAKNKHPLYYGRNAPSKYPVRDKESKYYLSYGEYPDETVPVYLSGGGYLFSGYLVHALSKMSYKEKIIANEDLNFGILMNKLNVTPTHSELFIPFIHCDYHLWRRPVCDFLRPYVIHYVGLTDHMWLHYHVRILQKFKVFCKTIDKDREARDPSWQCNEDYEDVRDDTGERR